MPYAYYNDVDPYVCKWVRNLIASRLVPDGEVDQRSIVDVRPTDLKPFTQCHMFCGIAGWSLALLMAQWPLDRRVWTGSPPCQPFSQAGKKEGVLDARHLWPRFYELIDSCKPPTVFIEQVARAATIGWLDGALHDLEGSGYSCGTAILPACSVGSPHQRDRLWIVADSHRGRSDRRNSSVQVGRIWVQSTDAEVIPFGPEWAVKPTVPPVAYDVPYRMEQCRAYGNAIVPTVAAEFVKAYMDCAP